MTKDKGIICRLKCNTSIFKPQLAKSYLNRLCDMPLS